MGPANHPSDHIMVSLVVSLQPCTRIVKRFDPRSNRVVEYRLLCHAARVRTHDSVDPFVTSGAECRGEPLDTVRFRLCTRHCILQPTRV